MCARKVGGLTISPGFVRALKWVVGATVVGAFVLALGTQAGEIGSHEWRIELPFIALAVLAALARGPMVAYPWWRIVRSWGYELGWWRGLRVYFHSGLARYLPGQYWYLLSRAMIGEREGVPKPVTAASTLVETVLVTGSAGGVALLGLATVPGWPPLVELLLLISGILTPIALVALTGSALSARFWDWLVKLAKRGHEPQNELGKAQEGAPSKLSWARAAGRIGQSPRTGATRALAACYGNWILYGAIAAFALAGVSGIDRLGQAPAAIGIFAASALGAAVVLFVPQGIVIREGVFVYLLNALLAVPVPEVIVVAALTRLLAMGAEGVWALAALRF